MWMIPSDEGYHSPSIPSPAIAATILATSLEARALDGTKFFYLETTGEGWEIGEMPPEYESGTAYIYEMEPTPIITHDWQATIQGT